MATPKNNDALNGDISSKITGTKFIHKQTEYQVFPEEFFSGGDVSVYFGDLFVDTITGLEFTLQEQVRPLFGYADYTYAQAARGQRLVQGTFRIAFKESGYLFTILEHLAQMKDKANPSLAYMMTNEEVPQWQASARQTIEDLLDYYYGDGASIGTPAKAIPAAKTYTTQEVMYYDWPQMSLGDNDTSSSLQTPLAKAAKFKGAVSQLQSLLIKNGYHIDPMVKDNTFNLMSSLKQRYSDGEAWPVKESNPTSYTYHLNGVPYVTQFYGLNTNNGVPWDHTAAVRTGPNAKTTSDAALQARLFWYRYVRQEVKVADDVYGNGTDGKFGGLTRHALALFQQFMEMQPVIPPSGVETEWIKWTNPVKGTSGAAWGGWVNTATATALAAGLNANTGPTGIFDVATKACVYAFQQDNEGKQVKLKNGTTATIRATGACDDATIALVSQLYNTKDVENTQFTPPTPSSLQTGGLSASGLNTNATRSLGSRVADYEAEIWGRGASVDVDHNRRTFFYDGGFASSGDVPFMSGLKKTGFDIYLTYGPIGIWALQNTNPGDPKSFSGVIPDNSQTAPFENTVHAIRAVQLTTIGQVLNTSGEAIEEIYSFMAKDLD